MPPKRGRDEDTKPPALDKKPRLNSDDKKALDGGDGGKKTKSAAWTKEQVRQLWKALDVRPNNIQWDAVAAHVDGRTKFACRDKWLKDILPKLEQFIDSRGE